MWEWIELFFAIGVTVACIYAGVVIICCILDA